MEEGRHNFFSLETLADLPVTLEKDSGVGWRLTPIFPQQP